ncbi:MAG TPA: chromosome partitioning protein ParA [Opitutaceae bacterium]|nr:chromosome partitioning protein ParA [Opitutaceae bacterium]
MKRTVIITIAVIVLLLAGFFIYRGYQANSKREAEAQRIAREADLVEQQRIEAARKAEAEAEARRLADARAAEEAEAAAAKAAEESRIKVQMEAARIAAEKEAARVAAEKETARIAKERADAEARAVAATREREAREAEEARLAAIKKVEDDARARERDRLLAEDRERSRLEALRRQADLDALARANSLMSRIVYPDDYKRRRHYYMHVEVYNAAILAEPIAPEAEPEGAEPAKP